MQESTQVFEILKWNAVGSWVMAESTDDNCAICRKGFNEMCLNCEAESNDDQQCFYVKGQCCHTFHKHCIQNWLKKKGNHICLHCNLAWNVSKCVKIEK